MVEEQHAIKKIKVLRIINRFNLGGPTYNAAYLTKYLGDEFETKLVGGEKDETEASSTYILDQLDIQPIIIDSMYRSVGFFNDLKSYRAIKKIIGEFKPDIVHTHASKAGALGRYAAIRSKVPVIVHTFHGNVFNGYFGKFKTGLYKKLERYLAKRSSAIIAISELQKKELVEEHKIAPASKIHTINLGFDLARFWTDKTKKRDKFRKEMHLAEDDIAIAIVGRLVPIKNHELFIRAIHKAQKQTKQNIVGLIVGDGETKENLMQLCRELAIPYSEGKKNGHARIVFTSWIAAIDEVNAGVEIAALSSKNEGTPVSLIEAQAAGLPIVSTDVGGIRDIVIPNITALLSPNGNEELFTAHLLQLVEDKSLRSTMQIRGKEFVEQKFHYSRLVSDMKKLYFQLLSR